MFDYSFLWSAVWNKFPELLQGAQTTLVVAVLSIVIGTCMALPLSVYRSHDKGVGYRLATVWVELSRNTPALFQIYMAYFGLGAIGIQMSSFNALLISLSFNNAGYLAEVFRGGLASVPKQQISAARSIGMTTWQSYKYVVFPQVFKIVYFPYINQVNWALLNTSLGMIIGVRELTGATQAAQSESFRTFEFFIVAAVMYYILFKFVSLGARIVAWRLIGKES
ncbi:amino acid ABC transporter permease [Pseudomonas putida]|uniref:amino acid ABC transporter permease n=1 Tax=Pseudomonas TaxID=286 RepID=UPI0006D428C0|nr:MULTISPECIES: amino acid ABC transporter permease [Pseudomonas]MBI6945247.1 amino acid ABC transporter permease [Pseudomonas putida]PZQ41553.1 MAG: amino acid ABC transporter permease [Pseudomonas putida]